MPRRFNMGEGQEENAIVTSTGNFVVAWDFAKVRKGQVDKYEIKKYIWQVQKLRVPLLMVFSSQIQ
jgi:hypothetical protein